MRIARILRYTSATVVAVAGILAWLSPLTAEAAAGSLTQNAAAVADGPSTLAMSGTASCTGGGTDSIQTVVVSQGLALGAVGTTSNTFPCDGTMYPWGILEGATLGSWAGGSSVTSIVAFSSSPLSTTDMATLSPASGTTLTIDRTGEFVSSTSAYMSGTASCTGGGTKTIQLQYNQYAAGVSGSGSATVTCDGSAHTWGTFISASGGTWSGEAGTAVANLKDSNNQTIATYTCPVGLAA